MHYRAVELEEGESVQYLGVYALRWKWAWGEPTIGFVEADISRNEIIDECVQAAINGYTEAHKTGLDSQLAWECAINDMNELKKKDVTGGGEE